MTPFVKIQFDLWMTIDVWQIKRDCVREDTQGSTFVNGAASDPTPRSTYWVRYLGLHFLFIFRQQP